MNSFKLSNKYDEFDEAKVKDRSSDSCNCETCRFYEKGPVHFGLADGTQIFGDGVCHQDDRHIIHNATDHEPCGLWEPEKKD